MADQRQYAVASAGVELGFIDSCHTGRPQRVGKSDSAPDEQRLDEHRFDSRRAAVVGPAIAVFQQRPSSAQLIVIR
jgi:hypothetical protein